MEDADLFVLERIGGLFARLRIHAQREKPAWFGSLERLAFARMVRASCRIDGVDSTIDEALAATLGDASMDERGENWPMLAGNAQALSYLRQAARDSFFQFGPEFLKAVHFMMAGHDTTRFPGQWRPGALRVMNQAGELVYEAPGAEAIDPLMCQLTDALAAGAAKNTPPLVQAALAHLNLTMIRPFKDANGRMARALHGLVAARGFGIDPAFAAIDEWCGENREDYYAALSQAGGTSWQPQISARAFLRLALTAHYQQGVTLLRRCEEYSRLFERISALAKERGIDRRGALPLFETALGLRLSNIRYRKEAGVSELVASRDLKRLVEAGLIEARGENRGRSYRAGETLTELREATRTPRDRSDPYELARTEAIAGRRA